MVKSQEWFSAVLDSISDAIITTDANGLITFMSPIAENLTKWPADQAAGQQLTKIFKIIDRNTRKPIEDPTASTMREETTFGLTSVDLMSREGTAIPIAVNVSPIKDKPGDVIGVLLVFRDASEHGRAEKLKDEFIGMISHEMRTPLTIVSGSLRTASTPGISEEDKNELLASAIEGACSLEAIIENLLELSRHQAGQLQLFVESVRIEDIVHDVIEELKARGASQRFKVDLPDTLPLVKADALRVERILHNLLENAINYSPSDSEIGVTVSQEGNFIHVEVSDQGKGILPAEQGRLFEPFERLGRGQAYPPRGLGLGLVVCKRLVEAQGGRIWVESEPGRGSTFCFTLPAG